MNQIISQFAVGDHLTQQVQVLIDLYLAALSAADPMKVVPASLPPPPAGRTVVVGIGKAAASMALAVERVWKGRLSGVVVVPHGGEMPLSKIQILNGSHPVPDLRSVAAAEAILKAVQAKESRQSVGRHHEELHGQQVLFTGC